VIDESYLIRGIVEPEYVSNGGQTLTPAQPLEVFQDDMTAKMDFFRSAWTARQSRVLLDLLPPQCSIIWSCSCALMLTKAHIRPGGNPGEYVFFVIHPDLDEKMGVKDFCEAVVEVLGWQAGEHVRFAVARASVRCYL
jgi:hypothetical protein